MPRYWRSQRDFKDGLFATFLSNRTLLKFILNVLLKFWRNCGQMSTTVQRHERDTHFWVVGLVETENRSGEDDHC